MLIKKQSVLLLSLICCIFKIYSMNQDDDSHSPFIQLAQLIDIREQQARDNAQSTSAHATNTGTFTCITPKAKLQDMVGAIPQEITQLIDWVCQPAYYRNLGLEFKGAELLLEGPPGTGKSTLAEAIASALHRDMYKLSSSSFITSFQGSGSERIRILFDQIRKDNVPVVLFIDEIDGLANTQANDHHAESLRTLYELQTQLDRKDPLVVCILATNNLEKIPAALRDRFAHNTVTIDLPNFSKRLALLKHYAQGKPLALTEEGFIKIAEQTEGLSCRVIEKTMQQAVLIASEKQKRTRSTTPVTISQEDVNVALYNTTQENKLPSYSMRKLLFNYYFQKLNYSSPENLHYLAMHSDGFSARSIQTIVQAADSFAHARRSSHMNIDDIFAAFYYDQKIKLPDNSMRARILKYYIKQKLHTIVEEATLDKIISPIAEDTIDNFTGKELKLLVENAFETLETNRVISFDEHNLTFSLYVGLYKELLKKAEPAVVTLTIKVTPILASTNDKSTQSLKRVDITKLKNKDQFIEHSTFGDFEVSSNYLDFINMYKPSQLMQIELIIYLLFNNGIKIKPEPAIMQQILTAINGLSCYTIREVIKEFANYMHAKSSREVNIKEFNTFASSCKILMIHKIFQEQVTQDSDKNQRLCIIS